MKMFSLHGGKTLVSFSLRTGKTSPYNFPMDRETLKYVLAANTERGLPAGTARALQLPLDSGKVVTLVGIRRSGKTYILYETMRRLEAQGVDRRHMIYLNFEDDRLLPIRSRELDLILRAHAELYPETTGRKYLFLDEVQNIPRWEVFVRRLHDTEDLQIFVTGSSSHLLTRELATSLRGRSISYEVFPLSFVEFLDFRGIKHHAYSPTSESHMRAALESYLQTGGLPEIVLADPLLRQPILKEYVDLVFYKDLVERYRIGNPTLLRQLLKLALGQPASMLHIHKLYNDFRSQGFELSKNTLYRYLANLEESYLIFMLPIADRSIRRQAINPKKLHPIDWTLGFPFVPDQLIDAGHRLETAVFLHWRRRREDLGYLWDEREIDLVVNTDSPEALINVAYSVTQQQAWDREMGALTGIPHTRAPKAVRTLVAHEAPVRTVPPGIEVVEAWRYLLDLAGRRPD
jgi:predicted AAA+ superfamily ATPase